MINISSIPPESRDDFRRNFPGMYIEDLDANNLTTSIPSAAEYSIVVPSEVSSENTDEIDDIEENYTYSEELPELDNNDNEASVAEIIDASPISNTENNSEEALEEVEEVSYLATAAVNYTRFKGADWFTIVQSQEIVLAGLGGIGSYVNFALSRLGPKHLYLFDDDSFESHNTSGQLVSITKMGKPKVQVAKEYANAFSNFTPSIYIQKYTETGCLTTKIMICGFDNIPARKGFYKAWKRGMQEECASGKGSPTEYLFIDGRLLAEEFQIICITGDDEYVQNYYENELLFDSSEVEEVSCTLKQTSHMAMMIASKMVGYFINFCNNLSSENTPRRLPYYTQYNGLLNSYEFKY